MHAWPDSNRMLLMVPSRYGSINQDYCVVQEMYTAAEIPKDGKQVYIAAICDGHGILGDKAS